MISHACRKFPVIRGVENWGSTESSRKSKVTHVWHTTHFSMNVAANSVFTEERVLILWVNSPLLSGTGIQERDLSHGSQPLLMSCSICLHPTYNEAAHCSSQANTLTDFRKWRGRKGGRRCCIPTSLSGEGVSFNHSIMFLIVAIIFTMSNINYVTVSWFCLFCKSVKIPSFIIIENKTMSNHTLRRHLPLCIHVSPKTILFILCLHYSYSCRAYSQLQTIAHADQILRRNVFPSPSHICKSNPPHEDQLLTAFSLRSFTTPPIHMVCHILDSFCTYRQHYSFQ